jgi:hypothetical protein
MGAQKLDKTSQNSMDVEEFLAGLRFNQRGKLDELAITLQGVTVTSYPSP